MPASFVFAPQTRATQGVWSGVFIYLYRLYCTEYSAGETQSGADNESDAPQWDLSALFSDPNDPRIKENLAFVFADSHAFAAQYEGKIAELTPSQIGDALRQYEHLMQEAAKPAAYANLLAAADTNPQTGAFLQFVREETTRVALPLLFFPLELQALPLDRLDAVIREQTASGFAHFLQTLRGEAAFCLSLPEERVWEEAANTGSRALVRLYEETVARLRFSLPGEEAAPLTLSQILDKQSHPDRAVRQKSAEALTRGLAAQADTLTFLFNTLLQNKATEDRLRGYDSPEHARHLSNDLTAPVVETVMQTAEAGYPLVARFYRAKQRLLKLPKLAHYDRYAPLPSGAPVSIPFDAAKTQVLKSFHDFSPAYADAARAFFDNGWIDACPRPRKRGGAFCAYVTPDLHPVILMSYLGKEGDVKTLAHELGHGVHSFLSRGNGHLTYHGTLPLAEVASTFAEMLVFDGQKNESREARRAALATQIDQSVATIFRQAALFRFEQAAHKERKNGELTTAQINDLWQKHVGAMFAGSVEMGPGHGLWWSYVRHFIATPFYVYAYPFGELLALALFRKYKNEQDANEGGNFASRYLDFLRAGGSKSPQDLLSPLGVDLSDAAFWQGALRVLEEEIAEFEMLASEAR